jgi:nucleoside-diphosphate-sugar epimerase
MTTIAVTGSGGLLGRGLLAALRTDAAALGITRIIGLDVRAPEARDPGLMTGIAADVRDVDLAQHLAGVDVVVHLAFQMDPIRDLVEMRSINVDGTRNVMGAARSAGVRRVIYLSSVVAYGAHEGNDVPLTEASPLRGQPGFAYAEHKREVEDWLWDWQASGEGPALTVLRSAAVLGPGVENFLTRLLELPRLPLLPDPPPLQFVHLDDIVGAVVHALRNDLDGAFNVSSDGWLDFTEVAQLVGRGTIALDAATLERLVDRAYRTGLGELDPAIVELFRHPWVVSNERLRATGWEPTRTNEEALLEAVLEHDRYVAVGRLRASRTSLRALGSMLGLGLVVASVAALRRR